MRRSTITVLLGAAAIASTVAGLSLLSEGGAPPKEPASPTARSNPVADQGLAEAALADGRLDEARDRFREVAEADPANLRARERLLLIALLSGDRDDAIVEAGEVQRIAPGSGAAQAADAGLAAAELSEIPQAGDSEAIAREALGKDPGSVVARWALAKLLIGRGAFCEALPVIDPALTALPRVYKLQEMRLFALNQAQDWQGQHEQLVAMHALFPDDAQLIQWLFDGYDMSGDTESAVSLLRGVVDRTPDDTVATQRLVDYLRSREGEAAAGAELERLHAAAQGTPREGPLGLDLAGSLERQGRVEEARALLASLLVEPGLSSEVANSARVALARLLRESKDAAQADALIAEVLAADPSHVDALAERAQALLAANRTDEALTALRTALGQEPRDSALLLLEAQIHERAGSTALANDAYARALDASSNGEAEAQAFAAFLRAQGQDRAAAMILQDASDPGAEVTEATRNDAEPEDASAAEPAPVCPA